MTQEEIEKLYRGLARERELDKILNQLDKLNDYESKFEMLVYNVPTDSKFREEAVKTMVKELQVELNNLRAKREKTSTVSINQITINTEVFNHSTEARDENDEVVDESNLFVPTAEEVFEVCHLLERRFNTFLGATCVGYKRMRMIVIDILGQTPSTTKLSHEAVVALRHMFIDMGYKADDPSLPPLLRVY